MRRIIVLAYWVATSASSTSPVPSEEVSEASSSGAKEVDSSSAGRLYSGSLVGPSLTPFDHTGPTVGTTRSFESPPVVSLHLPPYRGTGEPTLQPPTSSQQNMLVNVIDDGTVIHEISSPPNVGGFLTRQRSQSRGVGFVGEGGSTDLVGGTRGFESPLGFSTGGGGTQHRSSAFFPRSASGTGLSHLASARSVPVGSVPGYSAMTGGGVGPPTVMSPGNYHFTFATSVGGAAWSTGLVGSTSGGVQTLQPLTFTAYSYTGMSPLASTDATMSMRRAELADDVEATLYTPHVGDLSGLLARCINPANVCYSEEDESPTAGRGGGAPMMTPAFSSSAPPHLPKELHDWVFSIVYHRSFPSLSQDGSIGDCFKSFESLNNVVSSSVPSSLEDVGAAAAFDPEKVLKCLAHFDSSVADQTMRKALDTIHPAMESVCQAYYESTESSLGQGGGGASSPVKTPTRFRTTGGGGTKKMMSGGVAPSPTHPAHEIETMAWLANPALSVRFTMMLSAANSSPAVTEVAGGCADHHHPGPSPLITTTRPMFLLYTRSDAEFENLRALWFVHSRSYRYKLLAKLVNSRNIFHWFKWESFPINLPDGASVHLKLRSEGGPHVFLESEFFFPETISQEFRFNEHVSIIAKDFLMYPHRVYFGIGPRFRCYIDTLDQHLSHLVRLYLRDSLGAVAALDVDDEEETESVGRRRSGSSSMHRGGGATTTTRAQIEVGLFIDTIYNSPLMIVSSRMPVSDLDPSPIQRGGGDPDSDDMTLRRYSKITGKDRLILWQQLRKRWQHVDNQFGMDCLVIKLIMMSGAIGVGMGASLKGYEFCFTHASNVDMTILPMLMYYISANDANILSYCVPVMLTDMLGHLENGKLIDRAARLKGALAVANDQFSTLFGRPFSELASPPIPTWYMEHVNSPDIRLVNLFRDSPPVAVLVDQAPDVVELFESVAAAPQGSRAAWEVFKTKEIYTSRESMPEEVQAAISTMEWFIEEFVPANPHFVTGTVSLEVFDKRLMEIIHNPVDRNNLRAWEEFKKNSPIYLARHELLETNKKSVLQILNVVEWYMDSYADGYWLDYKYPWYFITNVYGSKYNEIVAMAASRFEDRNGTRVVTKFKSDISGIKHNVVDVIVESLEKEFVDPEGLLRGELGLVKWSTLVWWMADTLLHLQ